EVALRDEKRKAEVTIASLAEGVITIDDNGLVEYMNGAAERLTSSGPGSWRGRALDGVLPAVDEDNNPLGLQAVCRDLGQDARLTLEGYLTLRPGKRTVLEITVAPLGGGHGDHSGDIVVLRDVTEARRMARRMAHQATHDPLTNLVNRREFERRLERILRSARDDGSRHALCYIDLDQFKIINDSCGHGAGDELLKQIARLLRGAVRKRDTVCRLGGDEFGVLMEHCDLEHAVRTADTIRERTQAYRFTWAGRGFAIGTSIGVVAVTAESDDLAGVLRRADAACYAAKEQGRNRVHVYHDDDAEMARMHSEMRWVARINHALETNAFELYYQAVHAAGTQRSGVPYYELLLRMREGATLVQPGQFLPAAERYGLAARVDRWVVAKAFDLLAGHHLPGGDDAVWAINLSGASFGDEHFTGWVVEQLAASGVAGRRVCFELTETAAITNHTSAVVFLETLRERGVRFALDDFGSGLSSFAYLKSLPVDFLKIDGVFVRDLATDRIAHGIVKAIVDIGHLIGSTTIAEFVEDEATAQELERLGADYLQGFHFARPRPAGDTQPDASDTARRA
ncbi:MAG: EAL domain-containing protein, partial [Gammaproteobacteria bacterium]